MNAPRPGLLAPTLGGLLLAAATPPGWLPASGLLIVPALAVTAAVLRAPQRPLWHGYLLGCLHMACFSWSVRHVLVFAWAMIVLLGGLYYVAVQAAVRRLPARLGALGFGVAFAGACWLRANMPEIWYPHGQPAQSLWPWPTLLGSVTLGGEALANLLLAWLGAAVAELASSWRHGAPAWRAAWRRGLAAGVVGAAVTLAGHAVRPGPGADAPIVDVALVEPGFHLLHELDAAPPGGERARYEALLVERLVAPTRALLADGKAPDLVLWPESSVFATVGVDDVATGTARVTALAGAMPTSPARLLVGVNVRQAPAAPPTPAAVLVDLPAARVLGHQEKRCLVPGGEFQPGVRWLPKAASDWLMSAFAAALGSLPECTPGRELPPMATAAGVPFGALLCYDNAFPGPAAAQVAQGARLLCVLSNESWYEGGAELTQLLAMTVLRALETGAPIVRCTQDGWSAVVDGDGRVAAALPLAPAPQALPRTLRHGVVAGPGRLPAGAWLRGGVGGGAAAVLLALLAWRVAARRGRRR